MNYKVSGENFVKRVEGSEILQEFQNYIGSLLKIVPDYL